MSNYYKNLIILLLAGISHLSIAQNLVPNGSFEEKHDCHQGQHTINSVKNWIQPTDGTADYFNSCTTSPSSLFDVPKNNAGYQFAHSGEAYCGIISYWLYPPAFNYREYIQVELTAPLEKNQ
jgi:hypothetical protein